MKQIINFDTATTTNALVKVKSDLLTQVFDRLSSKNPIKSTIGHIINEEPMHTNDILKIIQAVAIDEIEYIDILVDCIWTQVG